MSWSTPTAAVVALVAGGVVLAGAAAFGGLDVAGQVLIGLAALGLFVNAALSARQRPRLAIGPGPTLVLQRVSARRVYERGDIDRIRLVKYPRLGRRVPMLELDVREPDGTEKLVIFGRWDLGTSPQTVFEALSVHGLVPDEK
ncbi:PH domain-containing protein [Rhodococcus rhodnii]|uniref:PH domain-containing protein n=1 Tax=Rhodococcus rhodnii TaxID=38312 RepID=UPI001EE6E533|nr:PH domain-containing protein [Rhodococcus rhodnii]